ncbi:MAG: hypothetical protein K2I36_01670, partial [Ureaplasma sp.]|nr:hypothetical protein [Ureaplasma sp.]
MKSYWDENIEPKIEKLKEKAFEFCYKNKEYKLLQQRSEEYENSKLNYSMNHRSFLYFWVCFGLIISFILIIPFYWNLKKYKEMHEIKKHFKNEIDLSLNNLLNAKKDWINLIDYRSWIEQMYELLSYKQMGPITKELVDSMNNWIPSDNPLTYNKNYNPYNTQWSIWNDRVIVINASKQIREKTIKEYSGSITIPKYYYSDGETQVYYKTITAYYKHPYIDIYNENITNFAFMQSCTNLNFEPINKSNKYNQLENPYFNKICGWKYNNPVQFRMIFTPSKQENFVNDFLLNNKCIPKENYLWKMSNFCYNNFDLEQESFKKIFYNCQNIADEFIKNDSLDYQDFLDKLWQTSELYTYNTYLSIKYLFNTPIFLSENQKTIINNSKTNNYYDYCPYYIWQDVLQLPIIKLDSECFNELISNKKINNTDINKSIMMGTTYKYIKKIINVYESGYSVPVEYIDCVPTSSKFDTFYCPINNNEIKLNSKFEYVYSMLDKEKMDKLENIVSEILENHLIIAIDNGFIAIACESSLNISDQSVVKWIQ